MTFRSLLATDELVLVPGVVDALTARIAERVGFRAVYATGAGLANSAFGVPDVGLTSLPQIVEQVRRLTAAVSVPVIADADTGFGGPLNVMQTVRELEWAGASAIQIEDQEDPKRCGHFDGKHVRPCEEMQRRVEAAVSARTDPDLVLILRTDAIADEGIDAAIARGRAYAEVGADVIFVEAPETAEDLMLIPREVPVPTLVNIVEGGKTPSRSASDLELWGYKFALYANLAMRVGAHAVQSALQHLVVVGDSEALRPSMLSWEERQELVQLDRYIELESKFAWVSEDSASGRTSHPGVAIEPR